jgi:MoxR-like ATPase
MQRGAQTIMKKTQEVAEKVIANVEKVIVGKHDEVQLTLLALLCQGHLLIEDVPGVGKTMLAKSIAKSIGCTFPVHARHAAQRRDGCLGL